MSGSRWLGEIDNAAVRELEPLGLDAVLRELPALNRSGDQRELRCLLAAAASSAAGQSLSTWESLAAMRGLGMLVASLRRLTSSPELLPEPVESVLVQLGTATDLPPARRETVGAPGPA